MGKNKDIKQMFEGISQRYDLANHVLSLGQDFRWRKKAAVLANPKPGQTLLDICCGSGDFAFALAKAQKHLGKIVGCDFSEEMIRKAMLKGGKPTFEWVVADCTNMSFEDESFDIVSCAFGLRNVENLEAALKQIYRVLKTNGTICILEFGLPCVSVFRLLYLFYLRYLLPIAGGLLTSHIKPYRYLANSIIKWSTEIDLCTVLRETGFKKVKVKRLSGGIAVIYLAYKSDLA